MERTAVVLYGPKVAGKSWVARQLAERAAVHHVDADRLVLDLQSRGRAPHPELGWLPEVEAQVKRQLKVHPQVSVAATGAWDSDWLLAERLAKAEVRVIRVWITAPLEVTLPRLAARRDAKVPTTPDEASWIHAESARQAGTRSFDFVVDTSGEPDPRLLDELIRTLR